MKSVPVFHLGMTRCASTFLRTEVFPLLAKREFIPSGTEDILRLGFAHCNQMNDDVLRTFKAFAGKPVLLSNSSVLCEKRAFSGKFDWEDSFIVSNLRELYGDNCKILVVIRRQDSIIESMVRHKQRFISDPDMLLVDFPMKRSMFGSFKSESLYDRLLSSYNYYRSVVPLLPLFGKENVFVLPYEQLVDDKVAFYARLSECVEEDLTYLASANLPRRNDGASKKYTAPPKGYVKMGHIARKINNLSGHRLEKFLPSRSRVFDQQQSREILDLFLEDNRRLDELFGLNLKSYGYY